MKLLRLAALLLLCLPVFAADPSLIFVKSFPASYPPYVEIDVQKDGTAEYKEDPKDDNPVKFSLSAANVDALFALAAKLDNFKRPIESGLKVANMGAKTFRYVADSEKHEVTFNYSEDLDARALLEQFENMAETERAMIELERTARFDKLGVQNALLRIEATRDAKRLVAPQQFLPMLDRVAKNESYLHMARSRAAALADSIRAEKP